MAADALATGVDVDADEPSVRRASSGRKTPEP